jgi:hypothetical protein
MTHFIEPSTEQMFSSNQKDSNIRMPSAESSRGGNKGWWLMGGLLIGTVIIIVINELVEK